MLGLQSLERRRLSHDLILTKHPYKSRDLFYGGTNHISASSGTAEARVVRFGIQVGYITSWPTDD